MRKMLVSLVLIGIMSGAATGVAGPNRAARGVTVAGGLTVHLSVGWHVLRGWLSDVTDPSPRLAVASFAVRLSRRTCACGFPNVVSFPRDGAFVFVWEYLHPSHRILARLPSRPARIDLRAGQAVRHTCDGASNTFAFKDAGRAFQVEVYLGPEVNAALRGQVTAMLKSLRVTPTT